MFIHPKIFRSIQPMNLEIYFLIISTYKVLKSVGFTRKHTL
jgi:hypothetical protein